MSNNDKTNEQLLHEIAELRRENKMLKEVMLNKIEIPGYLSNKVLYNEMNAVEYAKELLYLSQSNIFLNAIINILPIGIVIADKNGLVLLDNPAANTILGSEVTGTAYGPDGNYTLHRLDGSPFPPKDLPLPYALEHGEVVRNVEILVRDQKGSEKIIVAASSPTIDAKGNILGAVAIFTDITHRKKIEKALQESEERFRTSIENMLEYIFCCTRPFRKNY